LLIGIKNRESRLLVGMNFYGDGTVANYTVEGEFNGDSGYSIPIPVQDAGEPGFEDNIRFRLRENGSEIYDSRDDFPGNSDYFGLNRTFLGRGNVQVEGLR